MGNIRFQRLFNRNERAVIVAMDHCLFEGPLEGMTNLAETASRIASCVDGVLLSPACCPIVSTPSITKARRWPWFA